MPNEIGLGCKAGLLIK